MNTENNKVTVSKTLARNNAIVWFCISLTAFLAGYYNYLSGSERSIFIVPMVAVTALVSAYLSQRAWFSEQYDPTKDPLDLLRNGTVLEKFILKALVFLSGAIALVLIAIKTL